MTDLCRRTRERLLDLVLGEGGADPDVAGHAARCPSCSRELRRALRLEGLLRELPAAAVPALAAPSLPRRSFRGLRPAVAAAALLAAAAAVSAAWLAAGRGEDLEARVEQVRVRRVVDAPEAPYPLDERLLALMAGAEAVAMRRPTEVR